MGTFINDSLDWDSYNNVVKVCSLNHIECSDSRIEKNNGKIVKVYGWLMGNDDKIQITSDSLYALGEKDSETSYCSVILIYCTPEIQTAIYTYDLTKKCYLKGELKLEKVQDGKGAFCCQVGPRIILNSLDDIYFE